MSVVGGEPIPISEAVRLKPVERHPDLERDIHLGFFVAPLARDIVFLTDELVDRFRGEVSLGNNNLRKWREFKRENSGEEEVAFPQGYLDGIREFGKSRIGKDERVCNIDWSDGGGISVGDGLTGRSSSVAYFRPSAEENPKRMGLLHNHPGNSCLSITDAENFMSDPSAVVSVVTNHDGTVWIMDKKSRVDQYAETWKGDPDGAEKLVAGLEQQEQDLVRQKLGDVEENRMALGLLAEFTKTFPMDIYRIDPGSDTGVKCV